MSSYELIARNSFFRVGRSFAEARRLQLEHRAVASAKRHQFVMRSQFDHAPMFEHANAIRVTHRRESMRYQNCRRVVRRRQNSIENLALAPYIELRGRLVEQYHPRQASPHTGRALSRYAAIGRLKARCRSGIRAR